MESIKCDLEKTQCEQSNVSSRMIALEENMNAVDQVFAVEQAEIRKVENKMKKLKILMSSSLESIEEKISLPIQEITNRLATDLEKLKDDTEQSMTELKDRFDGFENIDVVNITRRLSTARGKINEIIEKTTELDIQLKEISRDKTCNLLLHGLQFKV